MRSLWSQAGDLALISMLCFSGGQTAAASLTARISNLLFPEQGDLIYVYVEGGTHDRPSCADSNGDYLSYRLSRQRAKEYLAGLMMAFSTDRSVTFFTHGRCMCRSEPVGYVQVFHRK